MLITLILWTCSALAAPPPGPPPAAPPQAPVPHQVAPHQAAPPANIQPLGASVSCTVDAAGLLLGAARPMMDAPPNPAAKQAADAAWNDITAARTRVAAHDVPGAWRFEKQAHKNLRAALNPLWGRAQIVDLRAPMGTYLDCLYQRIQLTNASLGHSPVVGASNEHARAVSAYGEARALHQSGDLRMAFLKGEDAYSKLDRGAAKVWPKTEAP